MIRPYTDYKSTYINLYIVHFQGLCHVNLHDSLLLECSEKSIKNYLLCVGVFQFWTTKINPNVNTPPHTPTIEIEIYVYTFLFCDSVVPKTTSLAFFLSWHCKDVDNISLHNNGCYSVTCCYLTSSYTTTVSFLFC